MLRLILVILLFIASLVNFCPVPAKQVWYVGIAVPEYPWIFVLACTGLLIWAGFEPRFRFFNLSLSFITLIILISPVVRAYRIGSDLEKRLQASFGNDINQLAPFHQAVPFSIGRMFSGTKAKPVPVKHFVYAVHSGISLDLNFSPSAISGLRPCLLEVHGGAWRRGDFHEIAHFNTYFANAGYQVATINYRLAPEFSSPAQAEDIHAALAWLRAHAKELNIDTNNFVLSGRSAGAQLVLATAYTNAESGIKGVAAFYGPTDMFWTYNHPDNMLIMDSRQVQRDFLGGTPGQVPQRYTAESPLLNVNSTSTPTLLVHGSNDAHVYYEQSVRLASKLDSLKVPNLLLSLPWATHGCEYNLAGPSGQLALYATERFFAAVTHK